MRRAATFGAVAFALTAIGFGVLAEPGLDNGSVSGLSFLGESVTGADIAAGEALYAESCASCHGAELEGQPDWRRRLDNGRMPAPPHDETGHTWHHSDRNLFIVTKGGVGAIVPGYESDMPAFEDILTDDEIADVLSYIKSTWPDRQREFQAEVSANDKGDL
ncbi:cytochrome c [Roseovarius spongiae]|uniref:Cytochrome c n=1 Tax=Roseovarius spongiae TaxID=2320272 RepID=A0A3A8B3Q9_9RHOB|nr:cytochrome c [Roseovarius spongiae]RKF12474.1 cytochrome c [Roseovarius spongiae]